MNETKLVNIKGLAEVTGIPARTLRSMMHARKIPAVKLGHRTVVFSPARVLAALQKFEVKAIS